jgi:hypothetical protein
MLFVALVALALFSAVASEIWSEQFVAKHWYLGFAGKMYTHASNSDQ